MSSFLSGGGRAYRLDLDIIKSPSTSWASNSSSPSSTLSESSNYPLAISTRKPRTPRKRPNQTYNEAAAILSTAYPKLFSKKFTKPCKFNKPQSKNNDIAFPYVPSDLVLIDNFSFLMHPPIQEKPTLPIERPCQSPGEINSRVNSVEFCDEFQEDFDAESILDEEIDGGIDSIMGNLRTENELLDDSNAYISQKNNFVYGYPTGVGFEDAFDFGFGMRNEVRAMKNVDKGDWWRFSSVNVLDINPKMVKNPAEKKKKKVEKPSEIQNSKLGKENTISNGIVEHNLANEAFKDKEIAKTNAGMLLKLDYDKVLNAWSDRRSPFSGEVPGSDAVGNDVQARLAQIDLFSETSGMREASVLRYKEKRRTRLFSKKIRYQVRKINADRRPRMKGRFVRAPNSPKSEQ
ncbi:protein CHLOROPLAST IMPORT APPARATUS 2-like [Olea europaea var. sylvestris]|uniref:CHLOROPLAST IMPORT APPARATUS 2-like n=1 Tax=Olea europaea subsp. europaea TaxID=158383 RepID=A0A8S0US61_OLEEU|nr:protein CHLOROPLAST IMPORT APPARATUS 2-like [Olea europaea var. sylvestris]CAA3021813.1 CHLOROPLAST IMPORT APPARATUS 2-like [Olea europaea subsp. europaea]